MHHELVNRKTVRLMNKFKNWLFKNNAVDKALTKIIEKKEIH